MQIFQTTTQSLGRSDAPILFHILLVICTIYGNKDTEKKYNLSDMLNAVLTNTTNTQSKKEVSSNKNEISDTMQRQEHTYDVFSIIYDTWTKYFNGDQHLQTETCETALPNHSSQSQGSRQGHDKQGNSFVNTTDHELHTFSHISNMISRQNGLNISIHTLMVALPILCFIVTTLICLPAIHRVDKRYHVLYFLKAIFSHLIACFFISIVICIFTNEAITEIFCMHVYGAYIYILFLTFLQIQPVKAAIACDAVYIALYALLCLYCLIWMLQGPIFCENIVVFYFLHTCLIIFSCLNRLICRTFGKLVFFFFELMDN